MNFKQLPWIPVGADFKFSQHKQENDESSLAERSEGQGVGPRFIVGPTFMAPWVGSGTYPVYFIKVHYRPSLDVRYPDEKVKPHHTAIFNHASGGFDMMSTQGGLCSVPASAVRGARHGMASTPPNGPSQAPRLAIQVERPARRPTQLPGDAEQLT